MKCFACKSIFNNLYTLIQHYKLYHGYNTNSLFKCVEDNCSQTFQNLTRFKKHVTRKHIQIEHCIVEDNFFLNQIFNNFSNESAQIEIEPV